MFYFIRKSRLNIQVWSVGFLLILPALALAQQRDTTRQEVQKDLEEAFEDFDPDAGEFDSEQLTQFLQDLAANPININRADADDLTLIPAVDLALARSIIRYRQEVKPFENAEELSQVEGIGKVTLRKIIPYITIGTGLEKGRDLYSDLRYWTSNSRFEMFSRYQQILQTQEGYKRDPSDGGYRGSALKYYQRMNYSSDHLSANLTQEKDPGETLEHPADFDFNSWHVALENNGRLQQFVAGDYSLSFGQGLVLWNGGTFGKGAEAAGAVARNERGIKPYTSAQEVDYFTGAAATYGNRLQLTGFYSDRKQDATPVAEDTVRLSAGSGMHRTDNEMSRKNLLGHRLYGGRIRWELPFGFIGATGYSGTYDHHIQRLDAVYARYDFEGSVNSVAGADFRFLAGPMSLFGELARSKNGAYGLISGLEAPMGEHSDFTVGYRNYARDFQSELGNGFGAFSGEPGNEKGFYAGLRHQVGEYLTFNAYFDQYRSPAPRFGTEQPTSGRDWMVKAQIEPTPGWMFYLQYKNDAREEEYRATDDRGKEVRRIGYGARRSARGHLEYAMNAKIRVRTRLEAVQNESPDSEPEYGYLMYQDLRFLPGSSWTFDARITVFETESFDTRVYQFENDLLYVFSSTVLFNRGQRLYLLANWEPRDYLELWAKAGITIFEDENTIGSGLNQIEGNIRSNVGLQARLNF